jgi:Protein of unknown function (DUF2842)
MPTRAGYWRQCATPAIDRSMSRVPLTVCLGLVGFVAYAVGAVTLADAVAGLHWGLQALYFVAAGTAWVRPAHYLILWAARKL